MAHNNTIIAILNDDGKAANCYDNNKNGKNKVVVSRGYYIFIIYIPSTKFCLTTLSVVSVCLSDSMELENENTSTKQKT